MTCNSYELNRVTCYLDNLKLPDHAMAQSGFHS